MKKFLPACLLILIFVGLGCSNADQTFVIPSPEIEGVDDQFAVICGGVTGADPGTQAAFVSPTGTLVSPLALDGTFSVTVCWQVGDIATFQLLDQDGNPITLLDQETRTDLTGPDVCPAPTNIPPTCS